MRAPAARDAAPIVCAGMARNRGTCVLVGLPPGGFPTALFEVVANCITLCGSFVGTRLDMAEALAFAAEGKVKADTELQPLSAINRTFAQFGSTAHRLPRRCCR